MPEYLTPGIYFEPYDAGPPVIRGLRTDITGFVGLAERGPLDTPVQIESWRQFQSVFGNFVPYGFLAYTVKGFFENGGRTCFIVRVAGRTAAKSTLLLRNSAHQAILQISAVNEGRWGDRIGVTLTQVRPSVPEFSLVVTRDRLYRESFPRLSLDPQDSRYFVRLMNEGDERTAPSQWIRVEDRILPEVQRTASWLPNADASCLIQRSGFLTGGQDGLATLTTADFLGTGDPLSREGKGLSALDRVDAVAILCIPDIHIQPLIWLSEPSFRPQPPQDPCLPSERVASQDAVSIYPIVQEQPPQFSLDDVFDVQQAMIEHCERHYDRVAILDAPVRRYSDNPVSLAEIQDWRSRFDSERGFGALYYPWIRVVDPLHFSDRPTRAIPPCGHIAGLYARTDFDVGVHKAPANAHLFWASDLTIEVNGIEQGVLNPVGINCLRPFPGRGIRVYGARTVSSNPDWRFVSVRRLMLMIEEAIDKATQWAVFEPHTFYLRQLLILSISSFLEELWRRGALDGATPENAFYVRCDSTTNPPEVVNQGKLITEIGVKPPDPAEFVIFRMGRTAEELEIVER